MIYTCELPCVWSKLLSSAFLIMVSKHRIRGLCIVNALSGVDFARLELPACGSRTSLFYGSMSAVSCGLQDDSDS